jgi:serine/threonine protein kinase
MDSITACFSGVTGAEMTTTLGTTLGGYELGEVVGRGAVGQVHQGVRIGTTDPIAVRVLRRELVADPELVARVLQGADLSLGGL